MNDRDVRACVSRAEQLLAAMNSFPDAQSRATAVETVQILLDLYGEGLARIVACATRKGDQALIDAFIKDELISHLLLVHDLHPQDIEERVCRALDEVRTATAAHGGQVELQRVEDGVAYLRLSGNCRQCVSSASTLQQTIEHALAQAAPELSEGCA